MIDGLRPYPVMKDSGVPWLGDVPTSWEVCRLRRILSRATERNHADLPLLSVVRERGVIRRSTAAEDENHNYIPDDLSNYKVVRVGQFAMNKMKAWQGSYGVSQHEGIVSPAYFVFDVAGVEGRFFHTAIRSRAYVPSFGRASDGVRIAQWDLSEPRMREISFAIPPVDEQAAIVRYLDHTDRLIRRYIGAKQKLIKLLEEHRQAIIHRAVTRGLDPNVRLKRSGVDWLGDVPQAWQITRLKDVAEVQTGLTLGKSYGHVATRSYPYIRVANVQAGHVDLRNVKRIDVPEREAESMRLRAGDVLMTEGGDIDKLGRGCVWRGEIENCLHQNHVFAVRCRDRLLPEFLVGLMASQVGRAYFQSTAKQTTNLAATNSTTLRAFSFALPSLGEQQAILQHISQQTASIARALDDAKREVSLIHEFRTRLIADVVTGKLDVREAAGALPDEIGEAEPVYEIEAEDQNDETDAENSAEELEEAEA